MQKLPYQQNISLSTEKRQYFYLRQQFLPHLRIVEPEHFLLKQKPHIYLEKIKHFSNNYPYFLKFDLRKYYPSISHQPLLSRLEENYKLLLLKRVAIQKDAPLTITKRTNGELPLVSRRFKKLLTKDLPRFLESSIFPGQGLPIGNPLSYLLSGLFLLDLDLNFKNPYLRYVDDYLLFFDKPNEPEKILSQIILPALKERGLEINPQKVKSGKVHRDCIDFLGFNYKAGYFTIQEEKQESFRKKIREITDLRRKESPEKIIKKLNNKILGFGHYYKPSSCKGEFESLDAFIRMKLRRSMGKIRANDNKIGNLILHNKTLESMGLKSLKDIKSNLEDKKTHKVKKETKKRIKSGQETKFSKWLNLENRGHYYEQRLILEELKKVTNLMSKLEKRIVKMEKKLDR